tara:strand:+ start:79 stop:435 length:357 start_codon:yes stop_codon:yes gene_type:complete
MPYNEQTVQRIREFFLDKNAGFIEKKMFSGICFMVDGKMCCGTHVDKKTGIDRLMCRIGDAVYESSLEKNHVVPMEFTGKPMKGYIYVEEEGFKTKQGLEYWLQLCLDFNPLAKASKK